MRVTSEKIYRPHKWERENKLSITGVFDFAFSNATKRELIRNMAIGSYGTRSRFDDPSKVYGIDAICWDVYYRPYMDDYLENPNAEYPDKEEAKKKYLKQVTIPELVECKVLTVKLVNEDGADMFISDFEELEEIGIIENRETKYKSNSTYDYNEDTSYDIVAVRPGERYEYAVQALKSVYQIDESNNFFE